MTFEARQLLGSAYTIQNSAGSTSISNNAVSGAGANTVNSAQHLCYPDAVWTLTADFASNPTGNKSVDVLLRRLNIDGTNDAPAPSASYLRDYVASFVPTSASGIQTLPAVSQGSIPQGEFEAYLFNNGTGVTINAWKLQFTPLTYAPAS